MAEGNRHLLEKAPDKQRYSAMEVEDPESSSRAKLVDEDKSHSSMKINKRALVVFFGVTTLAAAVIVVAVVLTLYSGGSSPHSRLKRDSAKFTLDDMLQGTYNPKHYQATWLSDDEYMIRGDGGSVIIINPSLNSSTTLVTKDDAKSLGSQIVLSADKKWILYPVNKTMQYRYSSFADYYVFNVETSEEEKIKTNGDAKIQYITWSPTGNSLVYVLKNDMYYIPNIQLPLPGSTRLTNTGKEHLIFNGVPDWVYQEEVLNAEFAFYFSKNSKFLTYIEFDDTNVKDFVFPWYGSSSNKYTTQHKIAYPKPGTSNPLIKVKVIDLIINPTKAIEVPKPASIKKVDHYVVDISWLTDITFSVQWLTRDQNYSITNLCQPVKKPSGDYINCSKNKSLEQRVINGWVDDAYMAPIVGPDYYLIRYPLPQGNDGDFIHIAKIDIQTGQITPITSGKWEVTKVYAFDDQRELLFYESTQVSPTARHVYSVSIKSKAISCLSCTVPEAKSGDSTYFKATFSKKGSWYILQSLGPSVPWTRLYSSKDPAIVVLLENNQDLKEKLKKLPVGLTRIIKVPSGNDEIYTKIVYPPFFDDRKKYAVMFYVYGGPGTQSVIDTWNLGFETGYLLHNFDMICVYVDARGTMGRGERFKHAVFHHLGRYEAADTINVARYMQSLPYVDKDKIAIWGWSYGGYLTSYVLGQNTGVFKLGMAVAPVADWRYYGMDSIYTERYMGMPQYNRKGYKESSVLPLAKNFKNVDYLLVHGTADDNVHFQNSAQLVKKLTEEEIDYQVQFYTDKNHGLTGDGTLEHLYHLLTKFLKEKGIAFSSS